MQIRLEAVEFSYGPKQQRQHRFKTLGLACFFLKIRVKPNASDKKVCADYSA